MKRKLLLSVLLSCVLITSGLKYPSENPKVQEVNESVDNLQEFVTIFLKNETESALKLKYGTEWIFSPDVVCESGGKKIMIKGTLNQHDQSKKITLNFEKIDTKYKVISITENP